MQKKILLFMKVAVTIYLFAMLVAGNIAATFTSLFTIILLLLSDLAKKKLKYSDNLAIIIYIFLISTEILGEVYHFYDKVSYFDIIMHTISSFVIAALSTYIVKLFYSKFNRKLLIIFIFSFSMGIAAMWEIGEFTIDRLLGKDMQKDTILTEVTSSYFSNDKLTPTKRKIENMKVGNTDFIKEYGGYIDIGLYDTIEDMICALCGAILFVIVNRKSEVF